MKNINFIDSVADGGGSYPVVTVGYVNGIYPEITDTATEGIKIQVNTLSYNE